MAKPTCSDPECDRDAVSRGMCMKHYQRWRKLQPGMPDRHRLIDRTGQRFGRLVVVEQGETKYVGGKSNGKTKVRSRVHWVCQCDCGNKATVWAWSLVRGHTRSCGCLVTDSKIGPTMGARNKVLREYKHNARIRGLCWDLPDEDFDRLTSRPCHYCGQQPSLTRVVKGSEFTYSGIDRMDNSLGYTPGNAVSCCMTCNKAKRDMSFDEFMAWIAQLTMYHWFSPDVTPSRLLKGGA